MLAQGCVPARWHRIKPGMGKEDVLSFAGQPARRTYDDNFEKGARETWYYDYVEPHTRKLEPKKVRFHEGRVTTLEEDPARLTELRRQAEQAERARLAALVIPPDVGFRCEAPSECKSGKCLDHKCTGPRDCVRPPGAECVADTDCCTLKCNMGSRTCGAQ
jgi:hypothetical protein